MQGEYRLSDEQSPLASSTLRRCLVSCFIQMPHLITFRHGEPRREGYCRWEAKEGASVRMVNLREGHESVART